MWSSFVSSVHSSLHSWYTGLPSERPETDQGRRDLIEQMYAKYKSSKFSDVDDVTPNQVASWMNEKNDKIILADCREEHERQVGTIPGAIPISSINTAELEKNATVVVFCTVGYRSGLKAAAMKKERPDVYFLNLKGGILLWCHDVHTLSNSDNRVHVFGKTWDLVPDNYIGVY